MHVGPLFNILAAGQDLPHDLPLITTIAVSFTAAWILGILTQKIGLSPIVGYLLAGVVVGPHTPGFVGDLKLAQQLAELGVILLMFGVGLHFHLKDLLAVKGVAIPGAIGQSLVATLLAVLVAISFGERPISGLVIGMAMSVASTVVLIRVLTDNRLLDSTAGHVAVGWLIVEDVFTVILLVIIPVLGASSSGAATQSAIGPVGNLAWELSKAIVKLSVLVVILLYAGAKVIPWIMVQVARLRSRELFTLTVLVMAIAVAAGSSYIFGASMALGAFLAGMVVGQSPVSQQAGANALPMRDAFAVLFFTSVGMLFDPRFIFRDPLLLLAALGIVLIGKPLAASIIVAIIGYPAHTGLVVALGLAQIGEFSFILAEIARQPQINLITDRGYNLLVACALVSITLNPILFRFLGPIEKWLQGRPRLWALLNARAQRRQNQINQVIGTELEKSDKPLAVIVGYGPVGRTVDSLIRKSGLETIIVDLNLETVQGLTRDGRLALFGDAFDIEVMHQALARATHLIISLPHRANRGPLIAATKLINPEIKVFVRAHYIAEREELNQVGADNAVYEEAEAAIGLARLVLVDQGADRDTVRSETTRIRDEFQIPAPTRA
jgi:CPA2 family monovalent cation:H+ antiporter-2